MTLMLLIGGFTTTATQPSTSAVTGNLRFEVGGNTVQNIFPISTIVSSYAPITQPTNR